MEKLPLSGDSHSDEVLFCLKTRQTAPAGINLTLNLLLQSHLSSCKCTARLSLSQLISCEQHELTSISSVWGPAPEDGDGDGPNVLRFTVLPGRVDGIFPEVSEAKVTTEWRDGVLQQRDVRGQ